MKTLCWPSLLAVALGSLVLPVAAAHAVEIKVSAQALGRTLNNQLFNGADGRYYFRGSATSPCFAYAQEPKVSSKDERIVIHVKTHAKLGGKVGGTCLGLGMNTEADVSVCRMRRASPSASGIRILII